jgi:hypothetical protein
MAAGTVEEDTVPGGRRCRHRARPGHDRPDPRELIVLKGYVTSLPASKKGGTAVIAAYQDLRRAEQAFRMTKGDLRAGPCSTTSARPSRPT